MTLSYERQWILRNDQFLTGRVAMALLKAARGVYSEAPTVESHAERAQLAASIVQNPWAATPLFMAYIVSHPALVGSTLQASDITDAQLDAAIAESYTWVATR
jgi:hypothetical protein